MTPGTFVRRFLIPSPLITAACWFRYRALVSPRSEVELTDNLKLGRGSKIGSFCKVKSADGPLRVGDNVELGTGSFVSAGEAGVHIGDGTLVGPNASIVGNDYRYDRADLPIGEQEKVSRGIRIGANGWIGAGAVILDGSTVGDGAIISAGSVVQGRIPAGVIAAGTPARAIARRNLKYERAGDIVSRTSQRVAG